MTFYVKTNEADFDKIMKSYLVKKGLHESKTMPVTFIFISGEAAYQKNRWNTKKSDWISLLWGDSVTTLSNKLNLHKKYTEGLIPTEFVDAHTKLDLPKKFLKILKPVGAWKGAGILVAEHENEIQDWIAEHPEYKEWIIQNYIKNPALKDGHKFHLRIPVLVKLGEVYISNQLFYVKAEEPYQKGDWLNPAIHDTHYSEKFKTELFPDILPDEWEEKNGTKAVKDIYKIIKGFFENEHDFRAEWNAKNGFEVFGVDVLFDKKKPYVLEINNKMSLKGRKTLIPGIVNLILDGSSPDYFTRIL